MSKLPPRPEPAVPPSELITKSGVWAGLYTAEQMQAYGQQCRDAALEEAAAAIESSDVMLSCTPDRLIGGAIALKIRNLK